MQPCLPALPGLVHSAHPEVATRLPGVPPLPQACTWGLQPRAEVALPTFPRVDPAWLRALWLGSSRTAGQPWLPVCASPTATLSSSGSQPCGLEWGGDRKGEGHHVDRGAAGGGQGLRGQLCWALLSCVLSWPEEQRKVSESQLIREPLDTASVCLSVAMGWRLATGKPGDSGWSGPHPLCIRQLLAFRVRHPASWTRVQDLWGCRAPVLPPVIPATQEAELSERYGPVFTVHLGRQKTVVLSGYEAVRDALVGSGQELADRPPIPIFQLIQRGGGIFFSSGEPWRAARQFTVRALHSLGVGQGPMADMVLQELACLSGQLDGYRGELGAGTPLRGTPRHLSPVCPSPGQPFPLALLGWAPSNITFALLFGRRFDYQDPVFVSLLGLIDEVMVLLGSPSIQLFNTFPRLGTTLQLHRPVLKKIEEMQVILKSVLDARRTALSRGGPVRSYVDALIQQGQRDDHGGLFAEANALACVLDVLMAGTETTSATLQWAVLLMARHPDVQGRVQEELDCVLGPGRLPRPEEQRSLPYTSAVLHEVQRFITLLPHVPRCTAADTRLGGYLLPKGTPVIPLLTSVLLDKTQWDTPGQFNPGHFLDAEGRFVKRAAFLPFSAGRRVCVGESLARTELFLLFAGLLQRYRLLPPQGVSPATLDTKPAPAFTMRPQAQALRAVPRS
ncbi:cytochrome P450 2W1 isoform X3 [Castor canadensis]|uniref:Cytochrome P450 2W1 isoform X3 n=1 Tax=Castor canadensis TaxID=51338 RepID=A0AC58MQ50_CASCN